MLKCSSSISEELYNKSTHFLLELLQNADDNTYDGSIPVLNFTYQPGQLRIDCNEVGFTEDNVRAICNIGKSTKKGKRRSAGYTGEKGIGFKSVFRVADVVWISSQHYSFKLDRNELLGMIAPIWDEFPRPKLPRYTSFYMKIAQDYNEEELVEDITSFDPTLLIFLRRIREINLNVRKRDGSTWSTRLCRSDSGTSGDLFTVLSQDDSSSRYVVRKHIAQHCALEPKRPGCFESEILLAFPLSVPKTITHNVYAFLPIRDYGLKVRFKARTNH